MNAYIHVGKNGCRWVCMPICRHVCMYPSLACGWGGYVGVCGVCLGRYIYIYVFNLFAYVICVCVYECIHARMYEGRYVSR